MPSFAPNSMHTGITCGHSGLVEQAARLANSLGIALLTGTEGAELILNLTDHHLELLCPADPSLTGPVLVDFVTGAAGYRRRHGGAEMLLRAVSNKQKRPLTVLDATGGLGRDAFILASHGCTVRLVERQPVIGALLADGLRRALAHPETRAAAQRIILTIADSRQLLAELAGEGQPVDVIYLDPMFPKRSKSAKVKKEMQVLQLLEGKEEDNGDLLAAALGVAGNRVVVKRPKGALSLPGPVPSHSHAGITTRFDVYLRPGQSRDAEAKT